MGMAAINGRVVFHHSQMLCKMYFIVYICVFVITCIDLEDTFTVLSVYRFSAVCLVSLLAITSSVVIREIEGKFSQLRL